MLVKGNWVSLLRTDDYIDDVTLHAVFSIVIIASFTKYWFIGGFTTFVVPNGLMTYILVI